MGVYCVVLAGKYKGRRNAGVIKGEECSLFNADCFWQKGSGGLK